MRVHRSGQEEGAKLAFGGDIPEGNPLPGVPTCVRRCFTDVEHDAALPGRDLRARAERYSVRDEGEMIREVNDSPYGLSGSIWTTNLDRAIRTARRVRSGVLSINTNSSVYVEAPFGGYKKSGIGRDLGMHGLMNFTEVKNVFIAVGGYR
jgi:hypothetical protein